MKIVYSIHPQEIMKRNNDLEEVQLDQLPEHDQLPSVEEVKASHAVRGRTTISKKHYIIGAIVFLVFVISASILGVVVEKRKLNAKVQTELEREEDILVFVSEYSNPTALVDRSSPQYQAAHWLAFEDTKLLPLKGKRFLQRYALMVLYFATSGDQWLYDLNFSNAERDECHWNHSFRQLGGSSIVLGVGCNDDDQVTSIAIDAMGLAGILPPELSLLTHLQHLSLDNNSLEGALPVSLHTMTQLESLELKNNHFATQVPKWLGNLNKLKTLALSNNSFRSTLPSELEKMTSLNSLALDDNTLSGDLAVLEKMPWLKNIHLQDNHFAQTLSDKFLKDLPKLNILNLANNLLQGSVPRQLFHTLQVLDLHGNSLNGKIPENVPHSTSLQVLRLSDNNLTGSIPPSISSLVNLQRLDVSLNSLDGVIPTTLGSLDKMTYLNLADNAFVASAIPPFLRTMPLLSELSFKATRRVGKIPAWIGTDLQNLILLDLDDNSLTGSVPTTIAQLRKMEYFLLSRNKLTGVLPTEMSEMSRLCKYSYPISK